MAPTPILTRRQPNRSSDRRHRRNKAASCLQSKVFYIFIVVLFVVMIGVLSQMLNKVPNDSRDAGWVWRPPVKWRPSPGSAVRFRPVALMRRMEEHRQRLDRSRSEGRVGIRPPRLALVVANMNKDPQSLMLLTILKGFQELGYVCTVYALEDGEAHSSWRHLGCQVSVLHSDSYVTIDWLNFDGVILSSLEARRVIPSLTERPFDSVPLVWLIQEDILGRRLPSYESSGWEDLVTMWRSSFSRANTVVFPDFSLPMMYNSLDNGNFYVISGSPVNVWEAESYAASHSRRQIRNDNGFNDGDLIMLVVGSYFVYDDLPWEYASIMNALIPEVKKTTAVEGSRGTFKFVFLCGDSTIANGSALQELASHMGFPVDRVKHFGVDGDMNKVLLMSDIVLYGSFQEEQSFPPLLVRAMSYGIPIVVPSLDIVKKHVVDQVNAVIFNPHDLGTLTKALSLLIEDNKLSELAYAVASSGKQLSKNMLASDCIGEYATLLEGLLQFPSEAMLPHPSSHIRQNTWIWELLEKENKQTSTLVHEQRLQDNVTEQRHNIVVYLEDQLTDKLQVNTTSLTNVSSTEDFPTQLDWEILTEMEMHDDADQREREEIAERSPRNLGEWDTVYNNARKADKNTKFETHERDEAELEKIGLQLCIYEIYNGEGTWPFLHFGSLYRGLSLSKGAQRPTSGDIDAGGRLPALKDDFYNDILSEFGAMFSIANKVDDIHNMPWIGFQSWRAAGRNVSLSTNTEEILERIAQEKSEGDIIYFWVSMMDHKDNGGNDKIDFWSMCDILNARNCRTVFEDAFRLMYGLPEYIAALPPMPDDGDRWSTLHSWVMPTPSFMEFVMFSRMFVDSMHSLILQHNNSALCILGSSELEKKHCYCRVLEVLVNVWAYHSARKLVYIDPNTGEMNEQHPVDQRMGKMWVKYFDPALLKSMDEELAEEADDGMHPSDGWLWPLTGEVYWPGISDKERENRYRVKMDKKRKNKEKILDRQRFGYKQKSLGKR